MSKQLSEEQKRAWSTFYVSHAVLSKLISKRMATAGVCSLEEYDILLQLELSKSGRLTMKELAEHSLFTKSGLTRLIDRLEAKGWVRRECNPADRRSTFAALTKAGMSERVRSWEIYQEAIRELFTDKLTNEELQKVEDMFGRFLTGELDWQHCSKPPNCG
ncbi:MAG: MarR family transcriptional regulator [Armatimonadetes bacterium]|nr:MarR family transcriptional regulator [Armatimonadota bacterium]